MLMQQPHGNCLQAYLHALPGQRSFQHFCGVLINRFGVGEAFVPLDQGAMVDALLLQGEAEAEAHNRHLPILWPTMQLSWHEVEPMVQFAAVHEEANTAVCYGL